MPIGIGIGIDVGVLLRGSGGAAVAYIALSSLTVSETAGVGDLVGTFSVVNGSGTYTFTLTDDAGGLFAVDVADLEVAAALSDGVESITVEADNGVDTPLTATFPITITDVPPVGGGASTFYWLGF